MQNYLRLRPKLYFSMRVKVLTDFGGLSRAPCGAQWLRQHGNPLMQESSVFV